MREWGVTNHIHFKLILIKLGHMSLLITVFPRILTEGHYYFSFTSKGGDYSRGVDYFKYFSLEVVP